MPDLEASGEPKPSEERMIDSIRVLRELLKATSDPDDGILVCPGDLRPHTGRLRRLHRCVSRPCRVSVVATHAAAAAPADLPAALAARPLGRVRWRPERPAASASITEREAASSDNERRNARYQHAPDLNPPP